MKFNRHLLPLQDSNSCNLEEEKVFWLQKVDVSFMFIWLQKLDLSINIILTLYMKGGKWVNTKYYIVNAQASCKGTYIHLLAQIFSCELLKMNDM